MSSNEYGAVFTQSGVPVQHSADYQRVLDSRWKFMEIAQAYYVNLNVPARSAAPIYLEKILDHNLGYLPAFLCGTLEFDTGSMKMSATKSSIWGFLAAGTTSAFTLTGWIYVFKVNMTEKYQANYTKPSSSPTGDTSYGAKFLEEGSTAKLDDAGMVGFSLNTQGKALSVHMHDTYPFTAGVGPTIDHNLGYPPTYFFAKIDVASNFNNNEESISRLGADARATITNQTISFRGAQAVLAGDYAYIILKDPSDIIA